jgi:hypothetical protein
MPVYRPRMSAKLLVPLDSGVAESKTLDFEMRVRSATLTLNDHNHADELELECQWSDLGIDPRFARAAAVEFHMGEADDFGRFEPSAKTFRFAGIADKIERIAKDDQVAKLTCRDFTALFLGTKPFPQAGVPSMSDTLVDAWQKICDHTGFRYPDGTIVTSVATLRDRIEFRGGVDPGTVLGRAVSARFSRGGGPIPVAPKADAWAVWQFAVGMLGLISFIDRDRCVVTTSADQFALDPGVMPRLIWGQNILEMTESAIGIRDSKGVLVSSFDPLTQTTLEASFNPNEKKQRPVAKKRSLAPTVESSDTEAFDYFGVTDPDVLQRMAQRIWAERATQELEGQLTTAEMRVGTDAERVGGIEPRASTDLLALRAGDSIRIEIDPLDEGVFSILSTDVARANYLIDRGYQPRAAWLLARNAGRLMQLGRTFKVRSSRIQLAADSDGGEFSVQIQYINRLELAQLQLSEAEVEREQ